MGAFALAKTLVGDGSENGARAEPPKTSTRRSWRRRKAGAAQAPVARGLNREPDRIYLAEHYIPEVDAQRVDAHVSRLVDAAKGLVAMDWT
jgi:hypothetical protein